MKAFVPITILTLSSILIIGCEFGNQTETTSRLASCNLFAPAFYSTEQQSLQFCVQTENGNMECSHRDPSILTGGIYDALTNPVVLQVIDSSQNRYALSPNNDLSQGQFIFADPSTQEIWADAISPEQPFLADEPHCLYKSTFSIRGTTQSFDAPVVMNDFDVCGNLNIEITMTDEFIGSCTHALERLKKCYQDSTDCSGMNPSLPQVLIGPYLDAKVITPKEIPDLKTLSYRKNYSGDL